MRKSCFGVKRATLEPSWLAVLLERCCASAETFLKSRFCALRSFKTALRFLGIAPPSAAALFFKPWAALFRSLKHHRQWVHAGASSRCGIWILAVGTRFSFLRTPRTTVVLKAAESCLSRTPDLPDTDREREMVASLQ